MLKTASELLGWRDMIPGLRNQLRVLERAIVPSASALDEETTRRLEVIGNDPWAALSRTPPSSVLSLGPGGPQLGSAAPTQAQAAQLAIPPNQAPLTFAVNGGAGINGPNSEVFQWATPRNLDIKDLLGGHEVSIEELLTVR
jgi:hypothetical protein